MNEEEIKKIARETFIENVMNNLDSAIIFKYVQELEQENARLKDKIDKAIKYLYEHSYYNDGDGVHYINEDEYCVDYLLDILKEN